MCTPLRAALGALALLVAPACAPVRAEAPWDPPPVAEQYEPDEAPGSDDWATHLDPYGDWVDDASYGPVWRPTVVVGWRPYVDGHWAWTAYGWTWISYEPWAWTLHYGRWVLLPAHGWVWVPGTVWGAAWVDWYWGAGYVGWAPLAPVGHVAIHHFVFVGERDFCARRIHHHVVHHRHLPRRVHDHWRRRDHRPPRRDRIERISRHGVPRVDGRPRHTLAPRGERRLARPDASPGLTGARRRDDGARDGERGGWRTRREGRGAVARGPSAPRLRGDDPPRHRGDVRRQPAAPRWSERPRASGADARPPRLRATNPGGARERSGPPAAARRTGAPSARAGAGPARHARQGGAAGRDGGPARR